jgi:uncharacterized protein (DUF2237 family)
MSSDVLGAVAVLLLSATSATSASAANCQGILNQKQIAVVQAQIAANPVVLFALDDMRCALAAEQVLLVSGICYEQHGFRSEEDSILKYLRCTHKEALENTASMWHSFLYIGGKYVGDGFKAESTLLETFANAGAQLNCTTDCSAYLSKQEMADMELELQSNPVIIYGLSSYWVTARAQERLLDRGVCFEEALWENKEHPKFQYLQCEYGISAHSFVFFSGVYYATGSSLGSTSMMSDESLDKALKKAHAEDCFSNQTSETLRYAATNGPTELKGSTDLNKAQANLRGGELAACTIADVDVWSTGANHNGTCDWEDSDAAHKMLCVTVSAEFLAIGAEDPVTDLSTIVQENGHWCIGAWDFARVVAADPVNLEGLKIHCDESNEKIRTLYQEHVDDGTFISSPGPVGDLYDAEPALDALLTLCDRVQAEADEVRPCGAHLTTFGLYLQTLTC